MSCMSVLSGASGPTPSLNHNIPEMGKVLINTTDQGEVVVSRADGNDGVFKKPLPRGPGPRLALRQKSLDEDTYTSSLQTIIERDFFPELPYLRAKQDFEDAVASRDPARIREAEKHLRKCAQTPLGTSIATPGRFSTGRDSRNPTPRPGTAGTAGGWGNSPSPAPGTPGPGGSRNGSRAASVMGDEEEEDEHAAVDREVLRMTMQKSLDQFCNIYTSEDNRWRLPLTTTPRLVLADHASGLSHEPCSRGRLLATLSVFPAVVSPGGHSFRQRGALGQLERRGVRARTLTRPCRLQGGISADVGGHALNGGAAALGVRTGRGAQHAATPPHAPRAPPGGPRPYRKRVSI